MVLAFDSQYSGSNSLFSGVWWWMKRGWGQWVIFPRCGYFDVLTAVGWVTERTFELWKPVPLVTRILFQNRWRKDIERDLANPGSSGKRPLTTDMVVKIMSTGTVESQGSKCQPNVLLCSMQNYARRQLFCSGTPWETCVWACVAYGSLCVLFSMQREWLRSVKTPRHR